MTAATHTDTLPPTGRHVVETEHSAYVIDMDARTFERWPAAPAASVLVGDGAALPLIGLSCIVGEPMRIEWRNVGRANLRTTTPVVSITAAH